MKVQPREADAFCRKPPESVVAVLLYGPDGGLVRERAGLLRSQLVPEADDPFRLVEMTGDALRGDPARLRDEAQAMAFGGGRRVVTIREAGDGLTKLFEEFLKDPGGDALILVEAGDLGPRGLRKAFEGAGNAAAVACYRDEGEGLKRLIRTHLAEAGLETTPDAMEFLAARLGGDRRLTRLELDKLVLYVGPGGAGEAPRQVDIDAAQAVVGDSAERTQDDLVLAVAGGALATVVADLARVWAEGAAPVALLRAMARHLQRLHLAHGLIAAGKRPDDAVKSLRPPVFWKQQSALAAQARAWPADRLGWALARLLDTEAACKRTGAPAQLLAERCLVEIAARAPKRR